MIAQNDADPNRRGKIINMSSQAGRRGEALVAVYCATKAAVISLTQSTGLGLIKHGKEIDIKEGTPLKVFVASDTTLPPAS